MNINPLSGRVPTPQQAQQFGVVRLVPLWRRYPPHNESWQAAVDRYRPLVEAYSQAGVRVLLCMTQEIGLEGQGHDFANLDPNKYDPEYIAAVRDWIITLRPWGIQFMNEMDDATGRASIRFTPQRYGQLFNRAYAEIKAAFPSVQVWTGGFNSGAGNAVPYFKASGIAKTDGIAFHPYGVTVNGDFGQHGRLEAEIKAYKTLGYPLGISEFGVLGQPTALVARVAAYARAFVQYAASQGLSFVSWYDWTGGDSGDHQGYAVINPDGSMRQQLYDALRWPGTVTPPTPEPEPLNQVVINGLPSGGLNFRAAHTITNNVIGTVRNGDVIAPTEDVAVEDSYRWRRMWHKPSGKTGWLAVRGSTWQAYTEVCQKTML